MILHVSQHHRSWSSLQFWSSEEKHNHHGQIHFVEDALGGPRVYKSSSIFLKMRESVGVNDGENCRTAGVAANPFFFRKSAEFEPSFFLSFTFFTSLNLRLDDIFSARPLFLLPPLYTWLPLYVRIGADSNIKIINDIPTKKASCIKYVANLVFISKR